MVIILLMNFVCYINITNKIIILYYIRKYMINNILIFTSLIFTTNIINAIYYKNYLYSLLFLGLTLSSIIVHSNDNIFTNILDKIIILLVIFYGGYIFINKINKNNYLLSFIIIITFLLCVVLYLYGYCFNQFCFSDNFNHAQYYHTLLHFIGSFGHNLIIIL